MVEHNFEFRHRRMVWLVRFYVWRNNSKQEIESELGDVLFTAVNMARHMNVDPELALRGANGRFKNRFVWIENELGKNGEFVSDKNIDDLNQLWNEAKRHEIEPD